MKELLETENLTKKYGNFVALDNLNLKVQEKTCVGFLGPNGAGKTTTIKILIGLIRPSSGSAFISGIDVAKDIRSALSDVGILVEIPQLYSNLNPEEILSYFGKLRGMNDGLQSRISEVLEHVKLSEWSKKKIGIFSKGMKQRVGIAAALLHNPTIIILDEPTSGLDPRGMIEVKQIIKQLKENNKTIFMSTHLLAEVHEVCDKVAIIDKGKLLRYDSVKNIGDSSDLESLYMKETSDSVE